jgi:imidazole glycerol-phosphate synthase subunit HisH
MIVVVDYNVCNVSSVVNMGRRAGAEIVSSGDPQVVAQATKLILPGVGAFDRGMANLHSQGLIGPITTAALERRIPVLGLCLGFQLLTRSSEEGNHPGLGWLAAQTVRFRPDSDDHKVKVPHMGWNRVDAAKTDPLVESLPESPRFYFVHSYYVRCDDTADVLLWAHHGERFAAGVRRGNLWGMQFHPEKSHKYGLALIKSFAELS